MNSIISFFRYSHYCSLSCICQKFCPSAGWLFNHHRSLTYIRWWTFLSFPLLHGEDHKTSKFSPCGPIDLLWFQIFWIPAQFCHPHTLCFPICWRKPWLVLLHRLSGDAQPPSITTIATITTAFPPHGVANHILPQQLCGMDSFSEMLWREYWVVK